MASSDPSSPPKFYALIDYEDSYVQPLVVSALEKRLPHNSYQLIPSLSQLSSPSTPVLSFQQYESIDFPHLLAHPTTSLANAYVIRKALIRKHYLSTTVANWIVKHPESVLTRCVKPSVEFEVDYAEFLDDALVEAWELRESWARGEGKGAEEREWWILKPGMSERGQGIRLFSSEEELQAIFEEWDPPESDKDDDDEENVEEDARSDTEDRDTTLSSRPQTDGHQNKDNGIITSQLRHFVVQPYIHPPLLLHPPSQSPPSATAALHKFHIRTYVLAAGALKIYVYKPMLALFAAAPYTPPWQTLPNHASDHTASSDAAAAALKAHLTNTCLQDTNKREGSVALFWALPDELPAQPDSLPSLPPPTQPSTPTSTASWKDAIFQQICAATGALFEAAARAMGIHFQPLPNAFELFGLDFLVSVEGSGGEKGERELRAWLLEVNAFPDFRQTGEELKGLVGGLFEGVVDRAVAPFFGVGMVGDGSDGDGGGDMVKVLDIDLGRR